MRRFVIAFTEVLLCYGQQQVTLLRTVISSDHSLRAREPPAPLCSLAAKHQRQPDPERTAGGATQIVRLDVRMMGASENFVEVLVAADQVSRHCEALEIVARKRILAIRLAEQIKGVVPCASFARLPSCRQLA
ncbi:MAG TPA: hypothetical protein VIV40_43280 [Kofleriaceae bacterium]